MDAIQLVKTLGPACKLQLMGAIDGLATIKDLECLDRDTTDRWSIEFAAAAHFCDKALSPSGGLCRICIILGARSGSPC